MFKKLKFDNLRQIIKMLIKISRKYIISEKNDSRILKQNFYQKIITFRNWSQEQNNWNFDKKRVKIQTFGTKIIQSFFQKLHQNQDQNFPSNGHFTSAQKHKFFKLTYILKYIKIVKKF